MDDLEVVVHAWILGVTVCLWSPADCTDSTLNVLLIFVSAHGARDSQGDLTPHGNKAYRKST